MNILGATTGSSNPLNIHWSFGFNKDVVNGAHSLSTSDRNAVFYLSSHSGVIYDFEHRSQLILQGHCNAISCCAVSQDKRWIVTADAGDDSILVIWDSLTGTPVRTFFTPHKGGCISVDISDDAMYVATLKAPSSEEAQEIAIWAWTVNDNGDMPLLREPMITSEKQHRILFNKFKQTELCTTGSKTVCFWSWEEFRLEGYIGKVSKKDFGNFSGRLTTTLFLGSSGNALTCSDEGYMILWETQYATILLDEESDGKHVMRTASKVLKLIDSGISTMHTVGDYIVVACADGAVRFYDYFLRLEAWFEDLCAGPVNSVSFSVQSCPYPLGEAGAPGLQFWVPDFVVGTAEGFIVGVESILFEEIKAEDRRGTLLMQGMSDDITCVGCHPSSSLVAFACLNGNLHMWDYDMKILINLREFNHKAPALLDTKGRENVARPSKTRKNATLTETTTTSLLKPSCLAFEPSSGDFIAVGFTSGIIKFLISETLEDMVTFSPSSDPIVKLQFSADGMYLAAYDTSEHVIIFKRNVPEDFMFKQLSSAEKSNMAFVYIGRIRSHAAKITGICFGVRDGKNILLSIGEDKCVVEYDLFASTVQTGVIVIGRRTAGGGSNQGRSRLDVSTTPTAIVWHPHSQYDTEERFIVANSSFKFKTYNVESKQCRKTTLAPTFGVDISSSATAELTGPPVSLVVLPVNEEDEAKREVAPLFYAYSTAHRVIGLGCFPLTGNPKEVVGLVAHPNKISDFAISHDGKYIFTSGGADLSVNMWRVNTKPLTMHDRLDMDPFYNLLEDGGKSGELYNSIVEFFYYCQIRSQGENVMDARNITGRIPVGEIATLMRAIGYFPSEDEIDCMVNEIRYKNFMVSGEMCFDLDLDEFVKLYVNYRPLFPLNSVDIDAAFSEIAKYVKKKNQPRSRGTLRPNLEILLDDESGETGQIVWNDLYNVLAIEGESLSAADFMSCLTALVGEVNAKALVSGNSSTSNSVDSKMFCEDILGFENAEA